MNNHHGLLAAPKFRVLPRQVLLNWYLAGMVTVFLVALALRVTGITWGFPHLFNIDEEFTVSLAEELKSRFFASGSLDPQASSYGTLPLYLYIALTAIAVEITNLLNTILPLPFNSIPMLYVGRLVSVLASAATVWITAELARTLFGQAVGLLSAVLLAICLLPVREAHFATVDSLLVCLVMLTLLLGTNIARRDVWKDYIIVGVSAATAVATKLTAAILLAPILLAHGYRQRRILRDSSEQTWIANPQIQRFWSVFPALTTIVSIFALWLALSPYVVLNPESYFDLDNNASALTQWRVVRGDLRVLYTLQFENTTPYLYVITNLLRWGMGLPLELLGLAGVCYSLWQLLRSVRFLRSANRDKRTATGTWSFADAYLLTWFFVYFLVTGAWYAKFIRYALPLIPVLCIFGARLIVSVWQSRRPLAKPLSAVIASSVVAAGLAYTVAYLQIYRQPDARLHAVDWLRHHIPVPTSILVEKDEGLFFHKAERKYGLIGYTWKLWDPYEIDGVRSVRYQAPAVSASQTRAYLDALLITDYIVISGIWYERFKAAAMQFPAQVEFYRLLFTGQSGYYLVRKFQVYPRLGPFSWRDDESEITFRLFDHPAIYVFSKGVATHFSSRGVHPGNPSL